MGFKLDKVCPYFQVSDWVIGETTCDGKKKAWEILNEHIPTYVMDLPQKKSSSGNSDAYSRLRCPADQSTQGIPKPEVIAGLFKSTAKRLANFVESVGHPECLIFTGGGAYYSLLVRFLERELKGNIVTPPEPELTAALGAALLA